VQQVPGIEQVQPARPGFVRAHTRPATPPLVPEVTLLVAEDVVALWEAITAELQTARGRPAEEPPFWAAAWPGGQALARYVLDHPGLVAGRTVLDLGSGSGLVAVAAALAGATTVLASEIDPFGLAAIALNAELNGTPQVTAVGDLLGAGPPSAEVVLAGDVCYDRAMTGRVLGYLAAARAAGADVLVGDPGRPYLPREGLVPLAGCQVPDPDGGPPRSTRVYRLP
jgi:predicted nicotinamide N-methyase